MLRDGGRQSLSTSRRIALTVWLSIGKGMYPYTAEPAGELCDPEGTASKDVRKGERQCDVIEDGMIKQACAVRKGLIKVCSCSLITSLLASFEGCSDPVVIRDLGPGDGRSLFVYIESCPGNGVVAAVLKHELKRSVCTVLAHLGCLCRCGRCGGGLPTVRVASVCSILLSCG